VLHDPIADDRASDARRMIDRFEPTLAPAGRLARLGVVLDAAAPPDRLRGLTLLCDRAGIEIVWLAYRDRLDHPEGWPSVRGVAADVRSALTRARLGLLAGADEDGSADAIASETLRAAVAGAAPTPAPASAAPASPRGRRSVLIRDLAEVRSVIGYADDVALAGWDFPDLESAADEVRALTSGFGRDPATLGVAALVPASVGRTQAEAEARAAADPFFGRLDRPEDFGIFGTLEECQDRAIALAHAGVTDLRCVLPDSPDLHDVIAQLTAITIGTTDVLVPGSLRSPAPPPPEGWGGRADLPPTPRVSAGSRRR
jgi:alkanesulfonate monooxygenase SsuD/methylene tetrahydromethanopterin reductase-like flavin-dependent oxidoreductase (luciferase family)